MEGSALIPNNAYLTASEILKMDEYKSLNSLVHDWYNANNDNYTILFDLFGPVTAYDLRDAGCVARIKKKHCGGSLKAIYYHPKMKLSFQFRMQHPDLDIGYMWSKIPLHKLISRVTQKKYFFGMYASDVDEVFEKPKVVYIEKPMTDLELIEKANEQITTRLGDAAWQSPTFELPSFEQRIA